MKLSISLSEEDIQRLDQYVESEGLPSRSAGLRDAIRMLGSPGLMAEYAVAFSEWQSNPDRDLWDQTAADGIDDEAW